MLLGCTAQNSLLGLTGRLLGAYPWAVPKAIRVAVLRRQLKMDSSERLLPTGECWCGCGTDTAIGSFFLSGHDKTAESAVISVEYGGVPEFLKHHGYGPGGKNARQEVAE